jgi:hypothetical protein
MKSGKKSTSEKGFTMSGHDPHADPTKMTTAELDAWVGAPFDLGPSPCETLEPVMRDVFARELVAVLRAREKEAVSQG